MLNQHASFELNSKGYLLNFDAWDKDFAVQMAKEHDLELTDCHWLVINFLRDYQSEAFLLETKKAESRRQRLQIYNTAQIQRTCFPRQSKINQRTLAG